MWLYHLKRVTSESPHLCLLITLQVTGGGSITTWSLSVNHQNNTNACDLHNKWAVTYFLHLWGTILTATLKQSKKLLFNPNSWIDNFRERVPSNWSFISESEVLLWDDGMISWAVLPLILKQQRNPSNKRRRSKLEKWAWGHTRVKIKLVCQNTHRWLLMIGTRPLRERFRSDSKKF